MNKTILVTGAGSGFGKGTAFDLAKKGHKVIAAVQIEPQKTQLLEDAKKAGVELEVIVLDITNERNRNNIFNLDIDILINNAGVMETGPIAEIPMDLVRRNYEVNVFGSLELTQGFLPKMIQKGKGKIIFVSSMGGLVTVPFASVYTSTKHALESIAEGLKFELQGTGIEICTVNPGMFGTGFNDRGAESMMQWFNPATSISKSELLNAALSGDSLANQLDPQIMVDAIVRVAEEENSKFRNIIPEEIVPWIKAMQDNTWTVKKDDSIWIDPSTLS
jgi:short-subunit dehydrogenase